VNSCRRAAETTETSNGAAKVEDKGTNAKLKVAFFKPFYGKYWIIDLAADYSSAVVGEPSWRYLWILSGAPQMSGGNVGEDHPTSTGTRLRPRKTDQDTTIADLSRPLSSRARASPPMRRRNVRFEPKSRGAKGECCRRPANTFLTQYV
jgi:hypothetical protein